MTQEQQFYVFFYDGYLSQWYPSEMKDEGLMFANCEQYMMFNKAKLFGDERVAQLIMNTVDPKVIKRLGRSVAGFNEKVWADHREEIVYRGNLLKFSQNPELRKLLLSYKNPIFVEASPTDRIWGIGFRVSDAMTNHHQWGQNLLGKIITKVYKYLLTLSN